MAHCTHDGVDIEVDSYGHATVKGWASSAAFPLNLLRDRTILSVDGDRITVCGKVVYEVRDWHHRCPSTDGPESALSELVAVIV